jgi:hypothetical protein
MNFETAQGASDGLVAIYHANNMLTPFKIVEIPFAFRLFSFTTGSTNPEDFVVFTGTYSGGLKQVIRVVDNDPIIYSINKVYDYFTNGHTGSQYFRSLSVKYGQGGIFLTVYYPVTEIHVDMNGVRLPGVADSVTLVVSGDPYSKVLTPLPGYIPRGFKIGDPPPSGAGTYTLGTTASYFQVTARMKAYFVYDIDYGPAEVTVIKMVTGDYANKKKDFDFIIYFTHTGGAAYNAGVTISYVGGIVPDSGATAPGDDILTTETGGFATFKLQHGQMITISVPYDTDVIIEEVLNDDYTTMFNDDAAVSSIYTSGRITNPISLNTGDCVTVEFLNTRKGIVPTGIKDDFNLPMVLPLLVVLISLTHWIGRRVGRRRKQWMKR